MMLLLLLLPLEKFFAGNSFVITKVMFEFDNQKM